MGDDESRFEHSESEREDKAPSWAKALIESNSALAKTVSKLAKQVRKLKGVVACLTGYQREDPSEETTEQEQERR